MSIAKCRLFKQVSTSSNVTLKILSFLLRFTGFTGCLKSPCLLYGPLFFHPNRWLQLFFRTYYRPFIEMIVAQNECSFKKSQKISILCKFFSKFSCFPINLIFFYCMLDFFRKIVALPSYSRMDPVCFYSIVLF